MGLGEKTVSGILWTSAGEIIVKFISPISFLILANILSPSDFGIVAIATTVLSFVSLISDLGTGKVLVQLKCDVEEFNNYCISAFWFNITMGIILFALIFGCSNLIADSNNQPNAAPVVRVMSIQVLFMALSTVQIAIMNREMNFKSLFFIRLITVAVPALVSIPLAFLGGGLWAIVFGNLSGSFFQMLALWFYSSWKPSLSFFKDLLYRLFSKSLWSSLQQIAIWIPIAFDTYLLSNYISSSALGFYSTARSLFQSVSLLIMGPILTVVFSSFSKIDDDQMFRKSVLFAQKILFSISVFIALFVFLYSNVIVGIVFSDEWEGITPVLSIIFILMGFETFYSIIIESLRARGFFKELALNNLISVLFSIPLVYVSAKEGLVTYTIVRCSSLYLCYFGVFHYSNKYLNISFWDCIKNCKYAIASIIMIFALAYIISIATCHYYILVTALFLTVISLFFFKEKKDILYLVRLFLHKNG